MTHPDDEVPDDFRPTNLEMLGETCCPGREALVAKFKETLEYVSTITDAEEPFDNLSQKSDIIKELGKTSRWLLEEATDEDQGTSREHIRVLLSRLRDAMDRIAEASQGLEKIEKHPDAAGLRDDINRIHIRMAEVAIGLAEMALEMAKGRSRGGRRGGL